MACVCWIILSDKSQIIACCVYPNIDTRPTESPIRLRTSDFENIYRNVTQHFGTLLILIEATF